MRRSHRALLDALRERRALDQFEHQRIGAVRFFKPVDARDVRMVQGGKELGFSLESGVALGVLCELVWKYLDGDLTLEFRVASAIDLTHSSGPNGRENFIRA